MVKIQKKKRKGRNQLYQRRMLGIGTEVTMFPILIARENVLPFVDRLGLLTNREHQFSSKLRVMLTQQRAKPVGI